MRKVLALAVATAGLFAMIAPTHAQMGMGMGMGMGPNPADVFLDEDTDAFDPGLPIGADFPEIRALYQGEEISGVDQFMGERGLAFFALRSADW